MINEFIKRQKEGLCPICKCKLHKDDKVETVHFDNKIFTVCAKHLNPNSIIKGVKSGHKMRRKIRQEKKSD